MYDTHYVKDTQVDCIQQLLYHHTPVALIFCLSVETDRQKRKQSYPSYLKAFTRTYNLVVRVREVVKNSLLRSDDI